MLVGFCYSTADVLGLMLAFHSLAIEQLRQRHRSVADGMRPLGRVLMAACPLEVLFEGLISQLTYAELIERCD
jgi:hypothetical protein